MQSLALRADDEAKRAAQVTVRTRADGLGALVETHDPDVLLLQLLNRP